MATPSCSCKPYSPKSEDTFSRFVKKIQIIKPEYAQRNTLGLIVNLVTSMCQNCVNRLDRERKKSEFVYRKGGEGDYTDASWTC